MELRDQIDTALKPYTDPDDGTMPTWDSDGLQTWRPVTDVRAELLAVVQPEIDRRDAEGERLLGMVQAVTERNMQLLHAEAERDRLRAAITSLIDEWEACISAGVMAGSEWEVCLVANLPSLRAALDQPGDQEGTR